jgi:uncharacterized protein YjdB
MNRKKQIPLYAGMALICVFALLGACENLSGRPSSVPLTGISLPPTLELTKDGQPGTLVVTYIPADTTETGVAWSSSNTAVATVSNGVVTAVDRGTATITATSMAHGSITATCVITVTAPVPLTGISLPSTLTLIKGGQPGTLAVTYTPSDTTETGVVWSSSNTAVATVLDGVVTPIDLGAATITATSTANSSKTATCAVTVQEPISLTGISLPSTLALTKGGQPETLTVTYTPSDTTETGVAWTSSDSAVATVSNGVVTPVGGGTATITATSTTHSSISASCNVTVTAPLIGISLTPNSFTIEGIGNTGAFTVAYNPADTTEPGIISWESSDTAVATVSGGTVTAVSVGTATITATSTAGGGKTANATVNVIIPLISIGLSDTTLNINKGGQHTLTVTYNPADTSQSGVIWTSNNTAVAAVSNGVVTAVGGGTAIITTTSTTHGDITASCDVTVTVPLAGINLPPTLTLAPGGVYLLPVGYLPADTTETEFNWESSDTAVATVSDGMIIAVADGSTIITATSTANPGISATCAVTVQTGYAGAGISIMFEGFEDETITMDVPVSEADILLVTAPSGFDRYLWYLDFSLHGTTTTPAMNLYVWNLKPGLHYFTVIVEKSGNHFSKTLAYRVGY